MYALYKQATEGDCKSEKPTENMETDDLKKCEAWCKHKGKSAEACELEYTNLAKKMLTKYGGSKLVTF
jgi:acyl-CoA-binding protein